ncbi:MAG: UreE urease accessory domain protein [Verrucomicrobiaceae bacterium]|nr:UreE urease accessory domain protein [Verrucomicrobiaceae bacterium]
MPLIEQAVPGSSEDLQELTIAADRDTLTRRRWRGAALDGTDFAFALADPVRHGSVIWEGQGKRYRVRQMQEAVLVVPLPEEPLLAARTAWFFGNMHLPIELRPGEILIAEEPTMRERITAAGMTWVAREDIFQPSKHCDTPAHSHAPQEKGAGWHQHGDGHWHKH